MERKWPRKMALAEQRLRWGLTWRAYLLGLALIVVIVYGLLRFTYGFLAVRDVVPGDTLVVEGWLGDSELAAVKHVYDSGRYRKLYLTGGPLEKSDPMNRYRTYPDLMLVQMVAQGVPRDRLIAVPAPWTRRDRTFTSAVALRDWFAAHGGPPPTLNICSLGAHTRRTRLLFEKAFGDSVRIGAIPVREADFDQRRWWRSSNGVRTVLSEAIAYLYARLIFHAPVAALRAL